MPLLNAAINQISDAGDCITVRGTFQLTGNYTAGAGNGELIDFTTFLMAKLAAGSAKGVPCTEPPITFGAWGRLGGATPGYTYGAGPNLGRIRFFTAAGVELTGAPTAYPAYMLAETYDFEATFRKFV